MTTRMPEDPAFNRLVAITDPNGLTTETQYADDLDRVRFVIRRAGTLGTDFELADPPNPGAGDLVTESVYDGYDDLVRTILPRENTIEYDYDHVGRLVSIGRAEDDQTHAAEQTEYTLDDFGRRTEESLQRWTGSVWEETSATAYVFANRCHLDRIVHDPPTGSQVTENAYDCNGNLTEVWDANHPSANFPTGYTQYAYDALDRLTSVIQPWGGTGGPPITTSYSYDVQDHLASVTDGEGNATTYQYSDRDLLVEEVSPASGTTSHAYDEHGELVETLDARGVTTTRTIDAADRVTAIEYSGDVSLDVAFTYGDDDEADTIGRLIGIERHGSTHTYAYDEFGRTIEDGALMFGYDQNGNRESITYPDGLVALYGFDFADREISLTADPGSENIAVASAATYLPSGPLTSIAFGNDRSETRAFTARYFPDRVTLAPTGGGGALLDWQYSTDAVGHSLARQRGGRA